LDSRATMSSCVDNITENRENIPGQNGCSRRRLPIRRNQDDCVSDDSAAPAPGEDKNNEPTSEAGGPAAYAGDPSLIAPKPHRSFRYPSKNLAVLYTRLDETLAEQRDAATELTEARRNLEEARRWLAEAESRFQRSAEDLRSRTEEMRERELKEPCHWKSMFEQLKEFRQEHGHTDPCRPWSVEGRKFTKQKLKSRRKKRKVEEEDRRRKEEKLRKEEETWNNKDPDGVTKVYESDKDHDENKDKDNAKRAEEKKEDESENSDDDQDNSCYDKYAKLGSWVAFQRGHYKKGLLTLQTPHRVRALDSIGMIWDLQEAKWYARYDELLHFKSIHGHCNIPQNYKPNPKLARWMHRQRLDRENLVRGRKGKPQLQPERLKLLEEAGIKWCERPRTWEDRYTALCSFRELHGHCDVPPAYEQDPQLANWVSDMRTLYLKQLREGPRKGRRLTLTDRRIKMLEDIGFTWHVFRENFLEQNVEDSP